MKILLALGSDHHALAISGGLHLRGWTVLSDPTGWDAEQFAEDGGLDAALIGAALPNVRRLAERLRAAAPDLALMAIGTSPTLALKERLFDASVDDVLSHPVEPDEISMRARAISRRRFGHVARAIRFGDLSVVPGEHASMCGRRLPLTRGDFEILEFLALRAGRAVGRGALMSALYSNADGPESRSLDARICRLRRELGAHGSPAELIGTVWGVGWIMPTPYAPGSPMPSHRAEVKRTARKAAA
jgi:DNA-binding response OmpR family regulator